MFKDLMKSPLELLNKGYLLSDVDLHSDLFLWRCIFDVGSHSTNFFLAFFHTNLLQWHLAFNLQYISILDIFS